MQYAGLDVSQSALVAHMSEVCLRALSLFFFAFLPSTQEDLFTLLTEPSPSFKDVLRQMQPLACVTAPNDRGLVAASIKSGEAGGK